MEGQIETLKAIMKDTDSLLEAEKIQERITRLSSGVAIIRVGAASEVEMIEKQHRVQDALEAVKSAQLEGVLPGGGSFLAQASADLFDDIKDKVENEWQQLGVKIVQSAIRQPLTQMIKNAGKSEDIILATVMKENEGHGYDLKNDKVINLLEEGIIDPARVTRCALQNSVSVASTLITSNYAIVDV